jgi:hypothetical protein
LKPWLILVNPLLHPTTLNTGSKQGLSQAKNNEQNIQPYGHHHGGHSPAPINERRAI